MQSNPARGRSTPAPNASPYSPAPVVAAPRLLTRRDAVDDREEIGINAPEPIPHPDALPAWIAPTSESESDTRINVLTRRTKADSYILGRELIWRKAQFRHGEWLPWCKSNLDCSEDTAERLMKYAKD